MHYSIYIRTDVYTDIHTGLCMYICKYIFVCMYVYMNVYIYVCNRLHTESRKLFSSGRFISPDFSFICSEHKPPERNNDNCDRDNNNGCQY